MAPLLEQLDEAFDSVTEETCSGLRLFAMFEA
jgi:hypothetical protein